MIEEKTKADLPIDAPVYTKDKNGDAIQGKIVKHGRKYITISYGVYSFIKVRPEEIEHKHTKLKRDGVGQPVGVSKLPTTGDPKYFPKVLKDSNSMIIDLKGRVMQHVGIGWVKANDQEKNYDNIPYLFVDK